MYISHVLCSHRVVIRSGACPRLRFSQHERTHASIEHFVVFLHLCLLQSSIFNDFSTPILLHTKPLLLLLLLRFYVEKVFLTNNRPH